ncbi:hypothetical protein MMC25_004888 [Agyrium rufum]|nr:hypothetical protein [Agyrium rufum]
MAFLPLQDLFTIQRRQQSGTSIGGALGSPANAPLTGTTPIATVDIVCQAVGLPVVTVIVFARLLSKRLVLRKLHAEDYICFAAWLLLIAYACAALLASQYGAGSDVETVPVDYYVLFAKYIYVCEIIYGVEALLVKLSILLLLGRVFGSNDRFLLSTHLLSIALVIYYIIITFAKIFSCTPVQRLWVPTTPGTCLNNELIIYMDAIFAMVTDLAILVLPVPIIWSLQTKTSRKLIVTITFTVGGLACVASILRLYANTVLNKHADKFQYSLPVLLWSFAEVDIGLICGCLPVMPALIKYMTGRSQSKSSEKSNYLRLERFRMPSAIHKRHLSTTLVGSRFDIKEQELEENKSSPIGHDTEIRVQLPGRRQPSFDIRKEKIPVTPKTPKIPQRPETPQTPQVPQDRWMETPEPRRPKYRDITPVTPERVYSMASLEHWQGEGVMRTVQVSVGVSEAQIPQPPSPPIMKNPPE